jgi:deoxyadenosine/deoxycytidine kinase
MEERDYRNYLELYQVMVKFLSPPDLVIYLRKSLPRLTEHIQRRGRSYEADIPQQYLVDLNRYYDDWMESYDLGKKLVIETDNLDFLNKSGDFNFVTDLILSKLDQRDLFLESRAHQPTLV